MINMYPVNPGAFVQFHRGMDRIFADYPRTLAVNNLRSVFRWLYSVISKDLLTGKHFYSNIFSTD